MAESDQDRLLESLGLIRFSDSIEAAFVRRIGAAAGELARGRDDVKDVVVRGRGRMISLLLNTCAQGLAQAPEVPGVTLHVKPDPECEDDLVHVEAVTGEGAEPLSVVVHHAPGMSDEQNEVYTQLLADGMGRPDATAASELLA